MSNLATCQNEHNAAPTISYRAPEYRVSQGENGYALTVDLPGVAKDAVEISVEKRVLSVKATRADVAADLGKRIHGEFQAEGYELALRLGRDVDASNVQAKYTDGVLTLELSKAAEAQARKIAVN